MTIVIKWPTSPTRSGRRPHPSGEVRNFQPLLQAEDTERFTSVIDPRLKLCPGP